MEPSVSQQFVRTPVALRLLILTIGILSLVTLTWSGLSGGLRQIGLAHSLGQTTQTYTQLGYGILSLLGVITTFLGRRWNPLVLGCWAVCVSISAGFASVAWGETSIATGLAAGAAALLIAVAIIWMVRTGSRVPAS